MEKITKICQDCQGYGVVSQCCSDLVVNNKCVSCGKFCIPEHCCDGTVDYKIGDKVEIFICIYSDNKLKEQLYNPKKLDDFKYFKGKILEINSYNDIKVKVNYRKEIVTVDLESIELL